jgi:hypothetical protein
VPSDSLPRRALLAAALLLLMIPGCAALPGLGPDHIVRRLLTAASQRAFARLDPAEVAGLPQGTAPAAAAGIQAAVPFLRDVIRNVPARRPGAIVRGDATAATDDLEAQAGPALFEAIQPPIAAALGPSPPLAAGQNVEGLRLEVARRTADAVFRAIAQEEAAIRADEPTWSAIRADRPALTRIGDGNGPL